MKTILLALVASSLALGLQAQPAATTTHFGELPVAQVAARIHADGDTVTTGTTRVMVALRIGAPNYVLPDGSWLYSNYRVKVAGDDTGRPATLVVRFAANRVSSLTMADQTVAVALRQAPRAPAGNRILTAANVGR